MPATAAEKREDGEQGRRERDEKPVRTAGLSWPSAALPGSSHPPALAVARPRAALSTGTGRSHYLKEGGHEEVWKTPPPLLRYTYPAVTAQSGNSGVRSPRTREGTSGSQRPAGATPGAGRALPAGWYGPRGGSRVPRALGGDPGRPRAEPQKRPGPGPGPGLRR